MGVQKNASSGGMEARKRTGSGQPESALATQLQQVWLQTQLPKRNLPKPSVPTLDFVPPLTSPDFPAQSSCSSSFSQGSSPSVTSDTHYEAGSGRSSSRSSNSLSTPSSDAVSCTRRTDPYGADWGFKDDEFLLEFLRDVLMEEDLNEKQCMYVQGSACLAMTKELEDLISDPGLNPQTSDQSNNQTNNEREGDPTEGNWMDEILMCNPEDFLFEEDTSRHEKELTPAEAAIACDDFVPQLEAQVMNLYIEHPKPSKVKPVIHLIDYAGGKSGIESLVDLYPLLMQCAQAVAVDDVRRANQLINKLRLHSSPYGDGGQRMTYYVVEALVARLSGTGSRLFTALRSNGPSALDLLRAYQMHMQFNPMMKVTHFFANASIYNEIGDAERVHIVDYGVLYGAQWPCLLRKLSKRPGGSPYVRLTGIDFPCSGFNKKERIQETGRRLAAKAKALGLEFEFEAIGSAKWETIQAHELNLKSDELLIVNCMFRLRNLLDESCVASNPRKTLLTKVAALKPKLFVMGVVSAGYNSPFFMARFRETINYFSAQFDALQTCAPPNEELRAIVEREIFGREILNVIACEGTERVERPETYRQWQSRSINAGFEQEPINPQLIEKVKTFLVPFNKNFCVTDDNNWLLTAWKDRVLHAVTSWRPAEVGLPA